MIKHIQFTSLLLLFLISLVLNTNIHAVNVDVYQSCDSGNDGDLLTSEIMNATSYGAVIGQPDAEWKLSCPDQDSGDGMWVSTMHTRQFPGVIEVHGKEYSGQSSRSWRFRNKYEGNRVFVLFGHERQYNEETQKPEGQGKPYHEKITIACFFTSYQTERCDHDNIIIGGRRDVNDVWGAYAVFQTRHNEGQIPHFKIHSCLYDETATGSIGATRFEPGKTYWINLHYDGVAGICKAAVFDPDNGWNQVGEILETEGIAGSQLRSVTRFGRGWHGDSPDNNTQTYISHILIDFTNAVFPLLPDNVHIKNMHSESNTLKLPITIYPNPSKGKCTIQLNKSSPTTAIGNKLRIYDLSGGLVDELKLRDGKFFWHNTSVSNSTYVMRLEGTKNYLCRRLLIMR